MTTHELCLEITQMSVSDVSWLLEELGDMFGWYLIDWAKNYPPGSAYPDYGDA